MHKRSEKAVSRTPTPAPAHATRCSPCVQPQLGLHRPSTPPSGQTALPAPLGWGWSYRAGGERKGGGFRMKVKEGAGARLGAFLPLLQLETRRRQRSPSASVM